MMTFKELIRFFLPVISVNNLDIIYVSDQPGNQIEFTRYRTYCTSRNLTLIHKLMADCGFKYQLIKNDQRIANFKYRIITDFEISTKDLREKLLRWTIKDDLDE